MKLSKLFFLFLSLITASAFVACDDDLNTIGGTIQPPADDISVATDTIAISAQTISMNNRVYAQTINGILGEYKDPLFGTIKADFLCQFYFPDNGKLNVRDGLVGIDSVQFVIDYFTYLGDTIAPMGLSLYKVTKELPRNFYTNSNPSEYTDMKQVLASEAFSVAGSLPVKGSTSSHKRVVADLGVNFGMNLYNEIEAGRVKDNASFNKYFPGMYVTTTFGSGTLLQAAGTSIEIHYSYLDKLGNYDNTKDTIRSDTYYITVTSEVNQLNHVQNTHPSELFATGKGVTYAQTPAGVCTEIEMPIKEIAANMAKNSFKTVNTASFSITGYTEKEATNEFGLIRPGSLLLIDKDSVDSFFSGNRLYDSKTSFVANRSTTTNSYDFMNISQLVSTYLDMNLAKNPTFVLIPVDLNQVQTSTGAYKTIGVYNKMLPTSAAFRTDAKNLRLSLIYSKF